MTTKTLIRGGTVVSMDPQVGDLTGDVLIEDDKIVAVEPNISADAEVIDASASIVIPGFVDTHRHTWEAAVRGCAPNATLDDYFVEVLDTFAPAYRAEDVYASNIAGSLECLNAGITTLVDWSHINNTPDHADAAVTALQQTGIRAQYAYGSANLSLAEYWFNSSITIPGDDVRRVRDTYFSSDDGLLTLALATRGTGFCMEEVVRAEWKLARELGIPITVHVSMGRLAGRFAMIKTGFWVLTRPTSTAATSATRNGGSSRTAGARSQFHLRWRCRWATAGRHCCTPCGWGCGPACPLTWSRRFRATCSPKCGQGSVPTARECTLRSTSRMSRCPRTC